METALNFRLALLPPLWSEIESSGWLYCLQGVQIKQSIILWCEECGVIAGLHFVLPVADGQRPQTICAWHFLPTWEGDSLWPCSTWCFVVVVILLSFFSSFFSFNLPILSNRVISALEGELNIESNNYKVTLKQKAYSCAQWNVTQLIKHSHSTGLGVFSTMLLFIYCCFVRF